jgi:hypothetical protein
MRTLRRKAPGAVLEAGEPAGGKALAARGTKIALSCVPNRSIVGRGDVESRM